NSVFSVSWSISTEIGMYLMFVATMIVGARRPALAFAAGIAYVGGIIWLSQRFGEISPNSLAVVETGTPALWARWFFYQSPYFRILQFAVGAGAAWIHLRYGAPKFGRTLATYCLVALAVLFVLRYCPPVRVLWLGAAFDPLTAALFAGI